MCNVFLETQRLIFEPLSNKHNSEEYVGWLNDKDVTAFNSHGIYPNTEDKTEDYINNANNNTDSIVLAILDKELNKHIGNIAIQSIDLINSNAEISIMLGAKESWNKGFGLECFYKVIEHCFCKLNLHKIYVETSSDNIGMQKLSTKMNMIKEASLKEVIKRNNNYFDKHNYQIQQAHQYCSPPKHAH